MAMRNAGAKVTTNTTVTTNNMAAVFRLAILARSFDFFSIFFSISLAEPFFDESVFGQAIWNMIVNVISWEVSEAE